MVGCHFLLLSRVAIKAVVLVHQFLELTARRWPLRGKVMLLLSILRRGSSRHLKDAVILLGQAVIQISRLERVQLDNLLGHVFVIVD